MDLANTLPLIIFSFAYFVLAVGKLPGLQLDRTGAALVGAFAMVASGTLTGRAAAAAIDVPTLALLLGMMIVVANLRLSGAFVLVARWLLERARSGFGLLALTVLASGVLAAFFINDVVCLALAPSLIEVARALEADPVPLLLALATGSNIGSTATITGNPQNMIVAGFAQLSYSSFAVRLAPAALAGLVVDYAVIALIYRRQLGRMCFGARVSIPALPPTRRWPLIKSSAVALSALVLFALGFRTHLVAFGAGAVLLFTRRTKPERVYELVDWGLLVMFSGLFIVVAGAETTGFQNDIIRLVGANRLSDPAILTAVAAVLSNLVSNVPAVMLFHPLFPLLGNRGEVALILASATTLAGNLTVLGSIANLIVIEQGRRENIEIGFWQYARVGVPVTLLTLALNVAMLRLWR